MLAPMLASLIEAPLDDQAFVYEPKYDGIRAIVDVTAGGSAVKIWSRLGNDKTSQFPEIAAALARWGRRRTQSSVLDGEIVALDDTGEPVGFQHLQGRIHLGPGDRPSRRSRSAGPSGGSVVPTAFIAFDLLRDGSTDMRSRPLTERRAVLETMFRKTGSPLLRLSEQVRGDGREMHDRALAHHWEGLIAKRADSLYHSGKRTPDWRKMKIVQEQEFVVGGWTEPRQTRSYFGALLLGVYEDPSGPARAGGPAGSLVYAGHVGTGFNERELARLMALLKPLETRGCPFTEKPPSNQPAHWVEPRLVVEVRFTEWTADGVLRHPVYLGLRDDKRPESVRKEIAVTRQTRTDKARSRTTRRSTKSTAARFSGSIDSAALVNALQQIEDSRRDGMLELPGGGSLSVTNLHKVFWPKQRYTKGDLFRYYAQVAPFLLPVIADRPLVMKRFPNGIDGKPFYQHRAQDPPPGVRVAKVSAVEARPQLIGGDIATLMYTTQLAAISQDPWFSRIESPSFADHVALDLDPSDGVSFARVLEVARWVHAELDALGAPSVAKTSGASGLHIYVPLPPHTPYDAGVIFAQIVATLVAQKHPKVATVERSVRKRGKTVYVDYLQNILGKTLACAYSARASDYAGVSTPLTWKEVDEGVRREDFTIKTLPARLKDVGDLWEPIRTSKGADLSRVAAIAKTARKK